MLPADKHSADQCHFVRQHLLLFFCSSKNEHDLSANFLDTAAKLVQQTKLNGYRIMKNKQELGQSVTLRNYIIRNVHESEI